MLFSKNINEDQRQAWLKSVLGNLPKAVRILDAGPGELKNKQYCTDLLYVSQYFCQYFGVEKEYANEGLQSKQWDTSQIELVGDITVIPEPDDSFDAILCSEVFEHLSEPTHALNEFARLLKLGQVAA